MGNISKRCELIPIYIKLSLHETHHDFEYLENYLYLTFNLRIICDKHDNDNIIIVTLIDKRDVSVFALKK